MEKKIVYFQEAGKANTERTLRLALERGKELGIRRYVVASTTGFTASKAAEILGETGARLIFVGEERKDFSSNLKEELESRGHAVVFLHEVNPNIPAVVENAYRKLCEGIKVATQCVAVAVDAGLIPAGEEVIAVAGTGPWRFPPGGGADTALVMEAIGGADYREDYQLPDKPQRRKIREIICMPR